MGPSLGSLCLFFRFILFLSVPTNVILFITSIYLSNLTEGVAIKSSPTPGILISAIGFIYSFGSYEILREKDPFDFGRLFNLALSTVISFLTFLFGLNIEPSVPLLVIPSFVWFTSCLCGLFFTIFGRDYINKGNRYFLRENGRVFLIANPPYELPQYDAENEPSSRTKSNCGFFQFLLSSILLLLSVLIAFHSYECFQVPKVPGVLLEIPTGTHKALAQINCEGQRSAKYNFTVLLEHGGGSNYLSMQPLLENLKKTYRVCGYTRLGFAWSEGGELPRTREKLRNEAQSILNAHREYPPYLIIGHSAGGELAKDFAYNHPMETKGIILLDSVDQIHWNLINMDSNDWTQPLIVYKTQFRLLKAIRYLSVLGLQYFIVGTDGYPESLKAAQKWSMMLDGNWNGQYGLFMENINKYDDDYSREMKYLQPRAFSDVPILALPAGLNATCEQRKISGSQCDDFLIKDKKFLDLQYDVVNAGGPGSMLKICDFPCAHDFAWSRADWILETIRPWIEDINSR
jgi:pimeloyl-ACP methyl ester carboxylesterase